ncbi:hypothetical protein NE237_005791 [Protea cynaroides]|uniref:1-phosphatidylinositol-3-phosphate 5-kinase n=1 Tax=Protea cynaroides TaxID=273540 RepID=A0A9Q0KL98_9MAGN|nr:hypothetical protein NE237_005791 [Protea cynaroides]
MTSIPRAGYSVQQEQMGNPGYQNDASLDQPTMAILRRPKTELETTENCSDEQSIVREQRDKIQKPLDFENNVLFWFAPPADDEEDESENNFYGHDNEADDVGESAAMFSSSSLKRDMFPVREKPNDGQSHRAVIHGHFRVLVSQLLQEEGFHEGNDNVGEDWLDIVTSVAWQAANFVKPDTSRGGSMDPRDYVKVKCIVSGSPSESTLVKGVVCTKDIKHKRMVSQYARPRLLLLGGALESPHRWASFDSSLEQEIDYLKMVISKIEAHHPNVLLVEKSVSSYAQEYLLAKEISLVLNVKRPLLERIARCTGALIVPSIDNLPKARLGRCENFRLERVSEECTTSSLPNKESSKTLMFFEGCPKPLGCTVLLKGTCHEELKKVKHVVQYAVFAAYQLSLEASFLADEGASLPKMPLNSPIAIPERMNTADHAISVTSGSTVPTVCQELTIKSQHVGACDSLGSSSYHPTLDVLTRNGGLTGFSTEFEPASEHLNTGHASAFSRGTIDPGVGTELPASHSEHSAAHVAKQLCSAMQYDDLRDSSMLPFNIEDHFRHKFLETSVQQNGMVSNQMQLEAVSELMKTEVVGRNEIMGEYFSAANNHQSILVSFSSRCVLKGTVCERSQLLRIKFYGSFDKPLGRFLRNDLFDQSSCCGACNEPPEAHVLCYTHQQGNLTVNVKSLPSLKLPGAGDGKIWMWHRCLKCAHGDGVPPATRRVVMSDAAWGLSFGKFLELSFSNHATANRVASCGHSLQRDCLRYYGCGSMVAFLRYSPIDILSVHLPPSVLEFSGHIQQRWVQKEAEELSEKKDSLYAEILDVLQSIEKKSTSVGHEPTDITEFHNRVMELKKLLRKEKRFAKPSGQASVDILELNHLRRCLLVGSFIWDCQLCSLDSLLRTKSSVSKSDSSIQEATTYAKLREWRNQLSSDHDENKLEMLEEPNFQPVLPREIKKLNIFNHSPLFISSASFWASDGVRLLLPQKGHNNIVVAVYDEEPTSVISYALISQDYKEWMAKLDELGGYSANESSQEESSTKESLISVPKESPHVKISFEDESSTTGKAKFSVTCYFAKEFDALRKKCCPSEVDFIRSLSCCRRWSTHNGNSNAYFAKSLDDRFVIKQVTETELDYFKKFAPEYFRYLTDSLTSENPTCLAKVLGIYQVTIKHLKGGWETKMNLMVMENLFFMRSISRVYDLKGSSRYNPNTTGDKNVLLDMNLLEAHRTKPIFLWSRANSILQRAIWNDTAFLTAVDVMDYSLLIGVDEEKNELVLGIINFMRKYTWVKHLETWVKKASGILCDPKNAEPTVISPKEYKKRFRKAMSAYFTKVPGP